MKVQLKPRSLGTKRTKSLQNKRLSKAQRTTSKSSVTKSKSDTKPTRRVKKRGSKPRAKAKQTAPRTEAQYLAKPAGFKETWDRVLSVISKMRSENVSLTHASRDVGISPRTVTRWGKSALQKRKSGRYTVKRSDNLLRIVIIPRPEGPREIAVRGSKQVSLLAEYWNALHDYLQTGDASLLKSFRGKSIKDAGGTEVPLPTDLAALNRLGSAGVLSFESLYARTT
jgi:hypothetical protein